MRGARRPVGFALHALLALVAATLLLFDCSRLGRSFPPAEAGERAPASSVAIPAAVRSDATGAGASFTSMGPEMATARSDYDAWQPTDFGGWYIAPKKVHSDSFDIIFHFHAGRAAAKEYRELGHGAVVVALTYGAGSKAYADALAEPAHFQNMLDEMEMRLRKSRNNPRLHVRRISLFAWSAGYGAIRNILTQGYYDRIDTIVLLDGLHANYLRPPPPAPWLANVRPRAPRPPPGHRVDERGLDVFLRFAQDAADGRKEFVFTHSSIVPSGYASTTETANVLEDAVHAKKVWLRTPGPRDLMRMYRADIGGFHVRGFSGTTKEAHIAQLHLVGEVLRELVVPRWMRLDRRGVGGKAPPDWSREDKAKRGPAGN